MTKEEAYKIVYKDLIAASLFRGIYDARHGNISFMNGIACVMEVIADSAGKPEEFDDIFYKNLAESEEKAKTKP